MEFTILGRTDLKVSRMGLGCGGHSRLGKSTGRSEAESIRVVQEAVTLGINFIDTAEAYETEEIVGKALLNFDRDQVVVSTKVHIQREETLSTPEEYRERVLGSLHRLRMEYVDILHIHGLVAEHYAYAVEHLVPVLQSLRSEGKIRFIGVTEAFAPDPTHRMLKLASRDEVWDVIMIGFNLLNQSARDRVFPWPQQKRIGTLDMFAVRRALSQPERLRELLREMVDQGWVDAEDFDLEDPLGFLTEPGVASSLTEAAYRFCLWEPGVDVVLSGTGNLEHLQENAKSLSQPPLPIGVTERLRKMFERVDQVSGN